MITSETKMDDHGDVDIDNNINNNNHEDIKFWLSAGLNLRTGRERFV